MTLRSQHNSLRQPPALWVRLVVLLFAAVQVIAPSWHVCEMGGNVCCEPNTGSGNYTCAMHVGHVAGDQCTRCKPHSGRGMSANHLVTLEGECLARLLQCMPAGLMAAPSEMRLRCRYARVDAPTPTSPRPTPHHLTLVRGPPPKHMA